MLDGEMLVELLTELTLVDMVAVVEVLVVLEPLDNQGKVEQV
jgi:hypothetical protein|tara:strand:+ start:332 stop:457 length:126 start_codon:yes stop_codon:yes gene_type:complete